MAAAPSLTCLVCREPAAVMLVDLRPPTRLPFYPLLPGGGAWPLLGWAEVFASQTRSQLQTSFKWRRIGLALSVFPQNCLLFVCPPIPSTPSSFNIAFSHSRSARSQGGGHLFKLKQGWREPCFLRMFSNVSQSVCFRLMNNFIFYLTALFLGFLH